MSDAGRGEGLAGLVAKWRGARASTTKFRAARDYTVLEECADELETALEAAARLPAAPAKMEWALMLLEQGTYTLRGFREKDYPGTCKWRDDAKQFLAALATPSPQAPPILLQDFNAKSGFGVFVVTGEHQRTAFFTRAAAEQYLAQQDPERFRIVVYPKPVPTESAGSGASPSGFYDVMQTASEQEYYASYANHCAIQRQIPMTFRSWKKKGKVNAPNTEVSSAPVEEQKG